MFIVFLFEQEADVEPLAERLVSEVIEDVLKCAEKTE